MLFTFSSTRLYQSRTDLQYGVLSEGVDEYAINKFLSEVFASEKNLHGKICSLVKESASRKFDMKEEVISLYHCCINVLNTELLEIIDVYG